MLALCGCRLPAQFHSRPDNRDVAAQRGSRRLCAADDALVQQAERTCATARDLHESALASLRAILGDDHPYTLATIMNLGTDLALAHDHPGALELSEEAYRRSQAARGDEHPAALASGLNYSLDLRSTGERSAAQALFEEVLAAMRRVLGETHPEYRQAVEGRRANRDIEVSVA